MRWLSSLRSYAERIFSPSAVTDDMDEELAAHVALRADDLERRGMARAEAERRARVEFGARERVREECQEASGGTDLLAVLHDVRFGLRMIQSHRWFSAAVIVTLALGIGLNAMVFTIVDAALLKPVPVPGGARLVAITSRASGNGDDRLSYPDLLDYRAQAHSLSALEGAADQEGVLSEPGGILPRRITWRAPPPVFSPCCRSTQFWAAIFLLLTPIPAPRQSSCSAITSGRLATPARPP